MSIGDWPDVTMSKVHKNQGQLALFYLLVTDQFFYSYFSTSLVHQNLLDWHIIWPDFWDYHFSFVRHRCSFLGRFRWYDVCGSYCSTILIKWLELQLTLPFNFGSFDLLHYYTYILSKLTKLNINYKCTMHQFTPHYAEIWLSYMQATTLLSGWWWKSSK